MGAGRVTVRACEPERRLRDKHDDVDPARSASGRGLSRRLGTAFAGAGQLHSLTTHHRPLTRFPQAHTYESSYAYTAPPTTSADSHTTTTKQPPTDLQRSASTQPDERHRQPAASTSSSAHRQADGWSTPSGLQESRKQEVRPDADSATGVCRDGRERCAGAQPSERSRQRGGGGGNAGERDRVHPDTRLVAAVAGGRRTLAKAAAMPPSVQGGWPARQPTRPGHASSTSAPTTRGRCRRQGELGGLAIAGRA